MSQQCFVCINIAHQNKGVLMNFNLINAHALIYAY